MGVYFVPLSQAWARHGGMTVLAAWCVVKPWRKARAFDSRRTGINHLQIADVVEAMQQHDDFHLSALWWMAARPKMTG